MNLKEILRWVLGCFMIFVGTMHFFDSEPFVRIVPEYLPAPLLLVYISGFFEILGGVGLLIPAISRYAAWGLVALYVAVFPANVNMAINQIPMGEWAMPVWALWLRLPVQLLLIAWAFWYTRKQEPHDA